MLLADAPGLRQARVTGVTNMTDHATTATLKADLAAVMRDAEALIKASADQGGAKVDEARSKIRESLETARSRLLEVERAARRQGEDAMIATEDYVKRNPWQAVGIAAGVGLVVGVLLARR
jgi:ElaB/YqjD/DUF883 family membrane-anchored ribosome-binding protein